MTLQPSPTPQHGHAVVIGAGIAGLLTARALSDTFAQVTILERDHLAPGPHYRSGVPQARHGHALQARGSQAFEELFPGLRNELNAAGAPTVDFCAQARLCLPRGVPAPVASGIHLQCVSRPLLEATIRKRVTDIHTVRIQDRCTVTGLQANTTGRQITGVQCRHRAHPTTDTTLSADLVIDASGRSSHLPDWLAGIGLPRPTETTVDARVGYASRLYRLTHNTPTDWAALFEILRARDVRHGGVALRIEDHQLLVTLQGADADHPPHDEDGFTAFMNSLHSDLASVVAPLQPISGIFRYARTENRRVHYHRIHPWPNGLITVGDAVCVFNPIYAQGMTVAALEALALQDMLSRRTNLRGFASRYQRRVAKITAWPWAMATLADQGWRTPPPTSPVIRAGQWYLHKWQDLIPTNQQMFQDFIQLAHMLVGPAILCRPRHLARILLTRTPPPHPHDPTNLIKCLESTPAVKERIDRL
jgi:2-polyprenyl-6-methoxyphenol hydroxylase-like FAD-dependent oxidoreductase